MDADSTNAETELPDPPQHIVTAQMFEDAAQGLNDFLEARADVFERRLQEDLWAEAERLRNINPSVSAVFGLLSGLLTMHMQPGNDAEPFRPMWEMGGTRSMKPSDVHGEQSAILAGVALQIPHAMLRARLGDVAFHNDRKHGRAARAAMDAYCEVAQRHVAGEIDDEFPDLDRSLQVALEAMLRAVALMSRTQRTGKVAEIIQQTFDFCYAAAVDRADRFGFVEFSDFGLDYRLIDAGVVARTAEDLVTSAPADTYVEKLRRLWALAARCHVVLEDEDAVMRCRMQGAEATLRMRDDCGQSSAKASWTMSAIGEMRHIKGSTDRIRVLRDELRQLQGAAQDEVTAYKWSMDVSDVRASTMDRFEDASLSEALTLLVEMGAPPSVAETRELVLDLAKKHPLGNMFSSVHVDAQGREIARISGLSLDEEPDDDWYKAKTVEHMKFVLVEHVNGRIEPGRRTLLNRFAIAERHVAPIVVNSHFVPSERMEIMAIGFMRMIQGDYLAACHLLFPQLENILRHILVTHGEDPSKIHPDLLQGDRALGALLDVDRPRLVAILGEDTVHLIDIIFSFRAGPSLRNELAHGKLPWGAFFSPFTIYGCWFILWLVVLPLRRVWWEGVVPLIDEGR